MLTESPEPLLLEEGDKVVTDSSKNLNDSATGDYISPDKKNSSTQDTPDNTSSSLWSFLDSVDSKEQIKLLEIIHLWSNFLSGWFLGIVAVALFMALKKDITPDVKSVCYELINFNLSFIIYFCIGFILVFFIIGVIVLPIIYILWLIFLVLGAAKHFAWEKYTYPMTIHFLK